MEGLKEEWVNSENHYEVIERLDSIRLSLALVVLLVNLLFLGGLLQTLLELTNLRSEASTRLKWLIKSLKLNG